MHVQSSQGYFKPPSTGAGLPPAFELLDICCGIGAASEALRQLRGPFRLMGYSEIATAPKAVMRRHHSEAVDFGDLTADDFVERVQVHRTPGMPLFVSVGFPCQSFSIAGKRQSLSDKRGAVSIAGINALNEIDPDAIVGENVKSLLSTADDAFGHMLAALVGASDPIPAPKTNKGRKGTLHVFPAAGYVIGPRRKLAWRVMDAAKWGLPQHRERVWFVAVPHGDPITLFDDVFKGDDGFGIPDIESDQVKVWLIDRKGFVGGMYAGQGPQMNGVRSLKLAEVFHQGSAPVSYETSPKQAFGIGYRATVTGKKPLPLALLASVAEHVRRAPDVVEAEIAKYADACRRRAILQDIVTVNADSASNEGIVYSIHWQDCRIDVCADVCATVTRQWGTGGGNVPLTIKNKTLRQLTPIEAARLQGFPDSHCYVPRDGKSGNRNRDAAFLAAEGVEGEVKAMLTDAEIYQCLGNSMAIPCAKRALTAAVEAVTPSVQKPTKITSFTEAANHMARHQRFATTPHFERLDFERFASRVA